MCKTNAIPWQDGLTGVNPEGRGALCTDEPVWSAGFDENGAGQGSGGGSSIPAYSSVRNQRTISASIARLSDWQLNELDLVDTRVPLATRRWNESLEKTAKALLNIDRRDIRIGEASTASVDICDPAEFEIWI